MPPRQQKPLNNKNLRKSRKACHQVEDEVNARLAAKGLRVNSPAQLLRSALQDISLAPPVWCEPETWRYKISFTLSYLDIFGSLALYERLRNLKERKVVQPQETDTDDSYMPALAELHAYKQKGMDDEDDSE